MSLLAPHAPTLIRVIDKGVTERGLGVGGRHELIVVDGERLGCSCGEGLVSGRFGGRDLAWLEHLLLLHRAERVAFSMRKRHTR